MKRWWKRPRGIVVDGAVWRWSVLDRPRYRELRVWREGEKRPAFLLRLTYPECWAIDLFRPKAVAYIIGWYERGGRRVPAPVYLQEEPALFQGLLDMFFLPEEREQREWFLERIKVDGPPPLKWEW